MKIISRYITSTYLRVLGLCTGAFLAIYLTVDFLEKIARFSRASASPQLIALYFLWKIPEILNQILPLATLMATLLSLGMLSRTSEIIAMRGSGMGLARITAPIIGVSLVASILCLISGELVVPQTYSKMKYVEDVLINRKNPNTFFRRDNIWYRQDTAILQARLFDPASRELRGITLWQNSPSMEPIRRIEAEKGIFTGNSWLLKKVVVRELAQGNLASSRTLPEMAVDLQLNMDDLKVVGKYADSMGFSDLLNYCRKLERGGYEATRYRAQMHSRISLPFAALIMSFLGIPFALRSGRSSGIAIGVGLSLGIGFSFHIINAILLSFGQEGVITPIIAAWAANAIFAAIAVWLAMTVNR